MKANIFTRLNVLFLLGACVPLFSQDNATASEHRYDVGASFSWYPPRGDAANFQQREGAPSAPFVYEADHSFRLKLNMGLRLYKEWSAYVDFGIDNQDMNTAIDFMARFGNRLFDLSLEYDMNNGRILIWDGVPFGSAADNAIENSSPSRILNYNETWLKAAFLLKRPIGGNGYPALGGVFFSSATVPVVFASHVADVDGSDAPAENATAFLDPSADVWTVGLRIGGSGAITVGGQNSGLEPLEATANGAFIEGSVYLDLGLGQVRLNRSLVAEAAALNPDFESTSFASHLGAQINFGVGYKMTLENDRVLYLVGGLDANVAEYFVESSYFVMGFRAKSHTSGIGPYVRARLQF